jgi:hypothetical protein
VNLDHPLALSREWGGRADRRPLGERLGRASGRRGRCLSCRIGGAGSVWDRRLADLLTGPAALDLAGLGGSPRSRAAGLAGPAGARFGTLSSRRCVLPVTWFPGPFGSGAAPARPPPTLPRLYKPGTWRRTSLARSPRAGHHPSPSTFLPSRGRGEVSLVLIPTSRRVYAGRSPSSPPAGFALRVSSPSSSSTHHGSQDGQGSPGTPKAAPGPQRSATTTSALLPLRQGKVR